MVSDAEDIWFDLYKSITPDREGAEKLVERQVRRRQSKIEKKLKLKRERIENLKDTFIQNEVRFQNECEQRGIQTREGKIEARRQRQMSAAVRLHHFREVGHLERAREQEKQLQEFKLRLAENQGTISELTGVIANLAAVRFLLEQVQTHPNN